MARTFLTLRSDTLSPGQRRTLLRLACAIAWADGNLTDGEHSELAKSLEELGGISKSEFEAMILSVKRLDETLKEELRGLPDDEAPQVVKLAFRIANADGRIHDRELEVVREASAVVFPEKPWDLVLDWMRSHQTMVGLVDLAPGTTFAEQFRVVRRLSEGGMGAVYVVEQVATGALRALKLMHPQLVADPKLRRRFEQEARVGARIESEHVVQVLSAGVDSPSGAPWLAMELLKGETLAAYADRVGRLPPAEVRELFEQLCHALSAAHAVGVVHRDLKPENIFLASAKRVGAPYVIKVLDFGIAKVASEAKTSDTAAIGTPIWMAPEQSARGQSIAPSTDVWALGLIAFRLLAGKVFWRCANEEDSTSAMLLREIVLDPIPPASVRAAELGCQEWIDQRFDDWFAKCVTRDMETRFEHAGAAFDALLEQLPIGRASSSGNRLAEAVARASKPLVDQSSAAFDATYPAPSSSASSKSESDLATSRTGTTPQDKGRAPRRRAARWLWIPGVAVVAGAVLAAGGAFRKQPSPTPALASLGLAVAFASASSDFAKVAPSSESRVAPESTAPMVSVPGGTFAMGSTDGEDDERPVHAESVDPFDMDLTEVTVRDYAACVDARVCTEPQGGPGCNWKVAGRESHPLNCVTWHAADTYCRAVRKRLPTEREWEYAARGKRDTRWPWGTSPPVAQICWNGDGNVTGKGNRKSTCEVTAFPHDVSGFGLLDMGGNVAEWTASRYCPYAEPNCGSGQRVMRGCAWNELAALPCTATYRDKRSEFELAVGIGFRCARTP